MFVFFMTKKPKDQMFKTKSKTKTLKNKSREISWQRLKSWEPQLHQH